MDFIMSTLSKMVVECHPTKTNPLNIYLTITPLYYNFMMFKCVFLYHHGIFKSWQFGNILINKNQA